MDRVFGAGPMHDLAGKKVEVKPATPRGSGPQGRGILLERPPGGAFRGFPPGTSGRGAFPPAYGGTVPHGQPGGPYSFSSATPGVAYAAPGMVNPYGVGYQMPYYGSMMLQQLTPYGYSGFGYPTYSSGTGLPGAQGPPSTPAAFEAQPHSMHGPAAMGPFGPGPGPGRGGGTPRFPSGCVTVETALLHLHCLCPGACQTFL